MIYITGDTHNSIDISNLSARDMKFFCKKQNVDYRAINYALVLGDFGLPWYECPVDEDGIHPVDPTDKYLLKWYNLKPFMTLAVMGNHDNYDMIEKLPEVEMFGSSVLKVSDRIFYLKRGEIYNIEGKSFLVLGGARSDDKASRTPHESWWEQEEWTEAEKSACISKIEASSKKFDYVLSHTGTTAGIVCWNTYFQNEENQKGLRQNPTVAFNDKIDSEITYEKWFFGHWHRDWGYEHYEESKYIPLYHKAIVV